MEVREIHTMEEIRQAYPVMKQLRSHLLEDEYIELVQEAMDKDMYHMAAVFIEGEISAVTGFKPMITLYYGRFVWVCDLVTDERTRSQGHGGKLLSFVEEWAKLRGYEDIALSSGLQREKAHRFYENKMNYKKVSYVFKTAWKQEKKHGS
ncbi:GNAT family N-acetyltransferase [Halobacillus salinarum]|uniref:GNAT family N-acetyltransferase n=1 Tax=Halobacillus salinarum TaxID=2932257 RepID=A0ABY4EHR2_9BACI|nr:GNAT family N-acetyltransferase [Halobacillus salinarum]UOQ43965.1 GNAT family N-acetyltransferase [Halobacillus salinarum]